MSTCRYDAETLRRAAQTVWQRGAAAISSIEAALMERWSDHGHEPPRKSVRCKCVIIEGDDGNHMDAMSSKVNRDDWCPLVAHRDDTLRHRRRQRAAQRELSKVVEPVSPQERHLKSV